MDGKRLFLAVPLTDMARNFLVDMQEKLFPVFGRRGRTRPESMHLTVKFLGSVNNDRITGLKAVVRESVHSISPFHLNLDRLTTFGKSDAPRIVAVSLTPIDSIRFLAEQVDQACVSLGFQMEKRPFSPHITIYRPKKPGKTGKIQLGSVIQIPVQELILFQSELKPEGAVYHVLEAFPLSENGGKENGGTR